MAAGKVLVVANLESAESSSRAAVPSAMSSAANFSYFGALKTSESDTSAVYKKGTLSDGKLTFEFDLPSATTGLILEVAAYPDTTLTTKPATTASLSAKKSGLSVENNTITISEKLALKPITSDGTGSVNLSITLPADYSLEVKNSTDSTTFTASQDGTAVTISASDVPANSYTLVFIVKKDGNIVYGWTETIVVYVGMTTDAWLLSGGATSTEAKEISAETITAAEQKIFYVRGSDFSDSIKSWYTTNLNSATASDENLGTLMQPLSTVQTAIDKVKAVNDGSSQYTIYVDGEFTAESGANVANIVAGSDTLKLSIIGLGSTKAILNGGGGTDKSVVWGEGAKLNLTLENLIIKGSKTPLTAEGSVYGGGIHAWNGTYTFKNCEIIENQARHGGGICCYGANPFILDGCIVNGNTAAYGGGILVRYGTVTLQNGTVIGDKTFTDAATASNYGNKSTGNGGGVTLSGEWGSANPTLIVKSGCYISGNYCDASLGSDSASGGVCLQQAAKLELNSEAFIQYNTVETYNSKGGNGGGVLIENSANSTEAAKISGSIIGNKAAVSGGGVYSSGVLTLNSGAKIQDNAAATNGGGIYSTSALTIGDGVEISGNNAKNGGGVYLNTAADAETKITGGVIKGNKATNLGGAFAVQTGKLTISGTSVIGGETDADANTATSGGAIYNSGTTSISGGIIKGNSATYGGAIFNLETLNLSDTAKIKDDIYLYTDKHITITATLTETTPVATITPASYTEGTQVLTAGTGVTLADEAPKFAVTPDPDDTSTKWIVGENGCLAKELTVAEACALLDDTSTTGSLTLYVNDVTNENLFNLTNSIYAYGIDDNAGDVTLIITGGGITEIGEDSTPPQAAFESCTCLVSLTIPSSVKTISAGQFTSCTNLETVTFANTSGWYYMNGSTKTVITASELSNPTTNATNLKDSGAWNEKELKCSTLSTTEIDSAGSGETISPSVTLENLNDMESLKTSVLEATTRGATINLTLTVTVKSQTELETLANYLDNTVMTESENIEKLSIDLIIADDSTIETIGTNSNSDGMFDQHTHLKTIKLPEGLKEITDGAFFRCENLTTVMLPTTMQTIGTDAFKNCSELSSINLPEGISTIGDSAFDSCAKLQSVTLPSTLTKIGDFAFYGTALSSITIPSSVTFIGGGVFGYCEQLTSVEFSETSSWYASGEEDLSDFEQIDVTDGSTNAQNLYTNDMVDIEGVWSLKYLYRKIDVNTAITQLTNATSGNLTLTVEVTSSNLSSLVTSLKSTGAESVDLILTGEDITTISTNTFRYASKLRSIVLPDTLTKIGDCSFSQCTQLQNVVIPNSVTEINTSAFSYCYALTEITIPSSVQLIGAKVFESCTALNSVTIENLEDKTWYYTDTYANAYYKTSGTEIDLSAPATNATYFKETYKENFWYREN